MNDPLLVTIFVVALLVTAAIVVGNMAHEQGKRDGAAASRITIEDRKWLRDEIRTAIDRAMTPLNEPEPTATPTQARAERTHGIMEFLDEGRPIIDRRPQDQGPKNG